MKEVATGVWRLGELPRPVINVYLAGDVLIDAGRQWDRRRILSQIKDRRISMLALTHVHPDHQGAARDVCEIRNVPLACHADDVAAMTGERPVQESDSDGMVNKLIRRYWQGPPHEVSRVLVEGDEVAGFRVVHAPGHARGEVIYFREDDRVAICGDVIRSITYLSLRNRIGEPPDGFTYDPEENRRSIRKLADLNPSVILPGHGPEVTDIGAFERFVDRLPA